LIENRKLVGQLKNKKTAVEANQVTEDIEDVKPVFELKARVDLHVNGDSRVLATSEMTDIIACTHKSFNPLFTGYGLRKISNVDFKANEFIPLHSNQIKDICFHPRDEIILSASLDKTLKLTNLSNSCILMTHNLETDAWSCCWNEKDYNYYYVGLRNGQVLEYDIRINQRFLNEIISNDKLPVSSIQYLSQDNFNQKFEGIVATHLRSSNFHLREENSSFITYPLPIIGNFISSHFNKQLSQLLISSRPIKGQTCISHTLYSLSLNFNHLNERSLETNIITVLTGGSRADQVSRSKIFPHPCQSTSSLVLAGDQDSGGCVAWDTLTKERIQEIKCCSPVFDVSLLKLNKSDNHLISLTSDKLFVYNLNQGL